MSKKNNKKKDLKKKENKKKLKNIDKYVPEENRSVEVIVNGSKSLIDSIDASHIKAYIDLSGKGVGEYSVPVIVNGTDTRATYTSRVKEIKVKISKK